MRHVDQIYINQLKKRKMYDIRISEFDSKKRRINEVKSSKLGDQEVDKDYDWLLFNLLIETPELTKVVRFDDQIEFVNRNEKENRTGDENGNGNIDEDEDEIYKDPQYCRFLEDLVVSGKSYKLKISQNDEEPRFLSYEQPGDSDWCDDLQTCIKNSGDEVTVSEDLKMNQKPKRRRLNEKKREVSTKKEVSKGNNIGSAYSAVKLEIVEYQKNSTPSGSDSDIVVLDNVQNCNELREKLMHILKQPYNDKEHEELSGYIEQEKPVCRLLPLRGRSISSALGRAKKSLLDQCPESFRRIYKAVHNDPPKALNLLRMFRFWIEVSFLNEVTFQFTSICL